MLCGIVDYGNIILKRERDFLEEDKADIENVIESDIKKYLMELLKETKKGLEDVELIGIAAPGSIKDGVIVGARNLSLNNFCIVERVSKSLNFKNIILRNDAKCAALCEKEYGSLKKFDDSIFLCLGTGIGGAVFLDGKLLKAKKCDAFELRSYDY